MSLKTKTRRIALLGLLTSLALILGYVEHLVPISSIPGIKLGLSNAGLLYALYFLDIKSTIALMVLKVTLSGVLFGSGVSVLYSFVGGVLSVIAMILLKRFDKVSVIGVSVAGAAMHNVGQIAVACFLVQTHVIIAYLPVLLIAAVISGVLTGTIGKLVLRYTGAHKSKTADSSDDSGKTDVQ